MTDLTASIREVSNDLVKRQGWSDINVPAESKLTLALVLLESKGYRLIQKEAPDKLRKYQFDCVALRFLSLTEVADIHRSVFDNATLVSEWGPVP